jgi:hypothetical protein
MGYAKRKEKSIPKSMREKIHAKKHEKKRKKEKKDSPYFLIENPKERKCHAKGVQI